MGQTVITPKRSEKKKKNPANRQEARKRSARRVSSKGTNTLMQQQHKAVGSRHLTQVVYTLVKSCPCACGYSQAKTKTTKTGAFGKLHFFAHVFKKSLAPCSLNVPSVGCIGKSHLCA